MFLQPPLFEEKVHLRVREQPLCSSNPLARWVVDILSLALVNPKMSPIPIKNPISKFDFHTSNLFKDFYNSNLLTDSYSSNIFPRNHWL